MSRLAHPWRGLSICCAETRLGVGPDIDTRVDACAQKSRVRASPSVFTDPVPVWFAGQVEEQLAVRERKRTVSIMRRTRCSHKGRISISKPWWVNTSSHK
jgi:hypothetical protein